MPFSSQQIRDAYKKLPSEIQNLIMDNETTMFIGSLLKEAGLNEGQSEKADGEILYAMYRLQSLEEAIAHIAVLGNKNEEALQNLKSKLRNELFDKYPVEKDRGAKISSVPQINPQMREQIKSNLMKRREEATGEKQGQDTQNPQQESEVVKPEMEAVADTEQETKTKLSPDTTARETTKDARYPGGVDPYREPLE